MDATLYYSDAKVAVALCKAHVCAYVVDRNSGINDEWILSHVVPNCFKYGLHMKLCLILDYLWQLFDPSGDDCMPHHR